jgi:hypothetical protein
MRVLVLSVALILICALLDVSTVAANADAWKCPPSTKIPTGVGAGLGEIMLVCKTGKAVVRTASGVSHVLTPSACFIGASGARLYFGPYPWDRVSERPRGLYLVIDREPDDHSRAGVIDGGLQLRLDMHMAVIGTARLLDGMRSGTFTIFSHLGDGVKGKSKYTGHWTCGTPLAPRTR